jgi:CubicO group peptidase (beta-lactamase class C family)
LDLSSLENDCLDAMEEQNFNTLAVGVIDFATGKSQKFMISSDDELLDAEKIYFDLASVTKPMTLHLSYLKHRELFDEDLCLLLDHRGGLPAYAYLDKRNWKEQIMSYPVTKSPTLYSDLGAIRLGLELEKKLGHGLYQSLREIYDPDLLHWNTLAPYAACPRTGFRDGRAIKGEVHDPRAFVIKDFVCHAGLFSTIQALCNTLLKMEEEFGFIGLVFDQINKDRSSRFAHGWDRAQNKELTLAGDQCGDSVFGHLGFTGNSVWIDPEKKIGCVILSNATQNYWYDKGQFNDLRRNICNSIWLHQQFGK